MVPSRMPSINPAMVVMGVFSSWDTLATKLRRIPSTEERDTAERDDLTPDESHREGEFDDLRDMLSRLLDKIDAMNERIDGIYDNFTDSVAQMVENGATVKETDDDAAEAIAQAAAEDLENLDYTL